MAQYESGQYINEFLNQMPNLLLTMRQMDVDQMLETRQLDQSDIRLDLERKRDIIDADMRERQMSMMEDTFGVKKKETEAWKQVKEPLLQAMQQRMALDESTRKARKDMSWFEKKWRPDEEAFTVFGKEIIKSEQDIAKEQAEALHGKPKEASEVFGDVKSISADLPPELWMQIYSSPMFQPYMTGKTGLLGATTAGSVGGYYP